MIHDKLYLSDLWLNWHFTLKLEAVHHTALQICSGVFCTSSVVNLYVNYVEPPLYLIHQQLSLELCYRLVSHTHHPLRTHLLTKEHDILYENCPSCIQIFHIRIRNILSRSSLLDTRVSAQLLLNITLWNFKVISYISPF